MTQDEIIEMAVQAGMYREVLTLGRNVELLTAFAKLVAKHEREECKKICSWNTGNQFVDEAVAVCYRAIDIRNEA